MAKLSPGKSKKILVILPAYNEAGIISISLKKISAKIKELSAKGYKIKAAVIENGSTDNTAEMCLRLKKKYPEMIFETGITRGRGNALKYAAKKHYADIYCYMDLDLSTSPEYLGNIIACASDSHVVIGSRYLKDSSAKRSLARLLFSKSYNLLIRVAFGLGYKDLQCGFKAFSRKIAEEILPLVKDSHWFFDTELVILARKKGYAIKEIPIEWAESDRTSVCFIKDIPYFLKKIFILRIRLSLDK